MSDALDRYLEERVEHMEDIHRENVDALRTRAETAEAELAKVKDRETMFRRALEHVESSLRKCSGPIIAYLTEHASDNHEVGRAWRWAFHGPAMHAQMILMSKSDKAAAAHAEADRLDPIPWPGPCPECEAVKARVAELEADNAKLTDFAKVYQVHFETEWSSWDEVSQSQAVLKTLFNAIDEAVLSRGKYGPKAELEAERDTPPGLIPVTLDDVVAVSVDQRALELENQRLRAELEARTDLATITAILERRGIEYRVVERGNRVRVVVLGSPEIGVDFQAGELVNFLTY